LPVATAAPPSAAASSNADRRLRASTGTGGRGTVKTRAAAVATVRFPDTAAIVAAARTLGCRMLSSEDFSRGLRIGGLEIRNPFR
jgi:hypothetical protein